MEACRAYLHLPTSCLPAATAATRNPGAVLIETFPGTSARERLTLVTFADANLSDSATSSASTSKTARFTP